MKLWMAVLLLLASLGNPAHASCQWPLWEQFKQRFIDAGGRVIDPGDPRAVTTSEGQAYAMFFALAAGDRQTFARLLRWSENNLAQGDLQRHLQAWLWGRSPEGRWQVLDANSAADADLWLAYSLQEAGRLWQQPGYSRLSARQLALIEHHEVAQLPQLGPLLLPGAEGFSRQNSWTLNPSYSPLPLLRSFAHRYPDSIWAAMLEPTRRMLEETSAKGFAPDWVEWQDGQWQAPAKGGWQGSYDAIRVYLWAGMQAPDNEQTDNFAQRFEPMLRYLQQHGRPPLRVDSLTGAAEGHGPPGFSAALLPLLSRTAEPRLLQEQLARLAAEPLQADAYYDHVLSLFGQGWNEGRYRFSPRGTLQPQSLEECS
ncbi:cellulose synthase complex periplasmic endoglucanase BcsZ [Pseudomonas sp. sp1636]|uniref:cellulose synthase complex periplasmic endoglucanase BcsZ n=1 Tax=Pseudomonas sp. sp1636 TaxID=3036707 RepID=UPI0025A4E7D2|nr:cellulose synthase complex periplasmic endoglucanase BcsZ [Pseudomonas sp. sp1636]MDM8349903.1 cellulose synthase complex periplasmic endoglucanase BcsZ [Pseudomonas sp. sp1636]